MSKKETKTHGGRRIGAGRKPISGDKSRAMTISARPKLMQRAKKLFGSVNKALAVAIETVEPGTINELIGFTSMGQKQTNEI